MQDYIPISLDINGPMPDITFKQYDANSRFIHLKFTDKDVEGDNKALDLRGCRARMYVQMDDCFVYFDGEVADYSNGPDDELTGIVTFLPPSGVTMTDGVYSAEIRLTNASEHSVLSAKTFSINVEKSLYDSAAIEAGDDYSALENALRTIDTLWETVRTLKARIDQLEQLQEGSTTGDAELMDVRIAYDGTVHESAGGAVRSQAEAAGGLRVISGETAYSVRLKVINGKPAIEYAEITNETEE